MSCVLFYGAMAMFVIAVLAPVAGRKYISASCYAGFVGSALVAVFAAIVISGQELLLRCSSAKVFCVVSLHVDALSAFFLLITALVGMAVSVYGTAYIERNERPRQLASLGNMFLLLLVLIFSVDTAPGFLFVWEMMAVVTFLLVNHESGQQTVNRAAWVYFAVAQLGAALIFVAFALMYTATHSFDFSAYQSCAVDARWSAIVFLFAFAGFAIKAGLVPAHGWLPSAHSAAPGNISALLSAVMLKMALYGLIRFAFQFCHFNHLYIALIVIVFGLLSAVYGIYLSLSEKEMKRILACSSIENMGLIFAMTGLALLFSLLGYPGLAAFAFVAALFHALNHAVVKSALFLCASTIIKQTHCGNLEKLGGLIKQMPFAGWTFVGASAAVCGLPLLNCFVSELLIFRNLTGITTAMPGIGGKLLAILALLAFGITIALVVVSFVRMLGTSLFGTPRSEYKGLSRYDRMLVVPQLGLLLLCVVIGLLPDLVGRILKTITGTVFPVDMAGVDYFDLSRTAGVFQGAVPLIIIVLFSYVVCRGIMTVAGKRKPAKSETWSCGIVPEAQMQYSARGLAQPFFRAFNLGVAENCCGFVQRLLRRCDTLSEKIRHIQSGNLHEYVSYILAVTVIMLVVIFFI